MSPILVRPVREQLEHDRVIRLLQQDLQKRKVEVGINPGSEQNASVGSGVRKECPDAVVYSLEKGKKVVAVVEVAGKPLIVGGGRYIVAEPGRAEIAFTVEDAHQGRGIASLLLRHLITIARAAGLKELFAEVLPDNTPMLKVFERSGLPMTRKRERDAVHVTLRLD